MQQWTKQGLVFPPPDNLAWMTSHAALPWAEQRGADHRVYFSGRDQRGRARIGFFNVNLDQPHTPLRVSERPVLDLGPLGAFDDNGTTLSCLVRRDNLLYMYYSGWTLGVTVPFYFYVGLAISNDDGESFQRVSNAPVLERDQHDPFLTASPSILVENGIWRMWYISALRWDMLHGQARHYYLVKYAESTDGVTWRRAGQVCIDHKDADEYAIGRPCVIKEGNLYRMWYSYRGESYRIGYAESDDGIIWQRKDDEAGIDVSASGWDAEMIAYPFVFDHRGQRYMLYNGNGYGKTGIGLAVLER